MNRSVTLTALALMLCPCSFPATVDALVLDSAAGQTNLARGLVAYWSFDGHLRDAVKDFHGTPRGTNPPVYPPGKPGFGECLQLDGTDQFVEITGAPPPTILPVANQVFVDTLAGSGSPGYVNANGRAAAFRVPNGPAILWDANLYLADADNHRIRFVNSLGAVTNFAGSGLEGFADGPAATSRFSYPLGVCVGPTGTVYVADAGNNRIRKITALGPPYGGTVSTVAGTGVGGYGDGGNTTARLNFPNDLVIDEAGVLFVTEFDNHTVRRITPDGTVSTWVGNGQPGIADGPRADARLMQPAGIARDTHGNLYVTEYASHRIRKIGTDGMVTTLAGDGTAGYVDGEGPKARFREPDGVVVDPAGYVYVTDKGNHAIRRVSPSGYVETVAGNGTAGRVDGPGPDARLAEPSGISRAANGFFYVTDGANHQVRRILLDPVAVTITRPPTNQEALAWSTVTLSAAASGTEPITFQWQREGTNVFTPGAQSATLLFSSVTPADAGRYTVVCRNLLGAVTSQVATLTVTLPAQFVTNLVVVGTHAGSGTPGVVDGTAGTARFRSPNGGALDRAGNLYVADVENHRIRRIAPDGTVATHAGSGVAGFLDGLAPSARFNFPLGVCVDSDGNVYVADSQNNRVRMISSTGTVTTLAGTGVPGYRDGPGKTALLNYPNDLVVDPARNLFVTDFANHTVRRIAPDGTVTTWVGNGQPGYADGPWSEARLDRPGGLALDADGNIYVAEYGGQRIRRVNASGVVTTLAGDGIAGYRDGPAAQARFREPDGIAVDPQGNVYLADHGNHAIRRLSPEGLVETVAGWGSPGRQDGTTTEAQFFHPTGLALDPRGTLFVTDSQNHQVRRLALDPSQIVVIVTQPASQTVAVGGVANLGLAVQGNPPLATTWYRNGEPIPGATGLSLVLTDIRPAAEGQYWAVVTNRYGSATSAVATLVVTQPMSPVLSPTHGHWYARIEAPATSWTEARARAARLSFAGLPGHLVSITRPDENRFLTEHSELGRGPADRLNRFWIGAYQPADAPEPAGGWLWVTDEPFAYHHWSPQEPNDVAPGEDAAMFNHAFDDDGKQWNDASDTTGSALGFVVEFEPPPGDASPPRIVSQPGDLVVAAGRSAALRVEAVSAAPPTYAWTRDGVPVANATGYELVFANAQGSDSGRYQAVVSNPHGSVTSRVAVLNVTGAGPGTVNFVTRITGVLDARTMVTGAESAPADGRFVAQIFAGPPGSKLQPAGSPVAFAETPVAARGYVLGGGTVELPGIGPGQPAEIQLVAWLRGYGASYEDAKQGGCYWGESAPVVVVAGGGLLPPANLVGLQGFAIAGSAGCPTLPPATDATPVAGPVPGHWYQRIDAPLISWSLARSLAEGMTYRGRPGHLVTIGSADENRFLSDHPQLGHGTADLLHGYWIGALRPASATLPGPTWNWVTPEPFEFAQWRPGHTNEPPEVESHAVFLHAIDANGKQWGLGSEIGPTAAIGGYVVEYEGGDAPLLVTQPESRSVYLGDTVTLSVVATGTAPLAYRWFHQDNPVPGLESDRPSLLLTNLQIAQAGDYRVVVSNLIDAVTSRVATITVLTTFDRLTNVVVSTLAGTGLPGYQDGPGNQARFRQPYLGASDEEGALYVADAFNARLRRVAWDGWVTTLAGSGQRGYLDGPAPSAQFNAPRGVARDSTGRLYVADTENHRLRVLELEGRVTTLAGTGQPGHTDGPAATATFESPQRVVSDADGNLFLTEAAHHVVRRVDRDGTVSTWAGTGQPGHADGDRLSARFHFPLGLALAPGGDLYVTEERAAHRIRRITASGQVTTVAGSDQPGYRDGPAPEARFRDPAGLALDRTGNLYVADAGNHVIRRITPAGQVSTVAGSGIGGSWDGPGETAEFSEPASIVVDPLGVLYVGDLAYSTIRRVQIGSIPQDPPIITTQPESVVGTEGQSATFRVAASGMPPLRYLWHRYAAPIPDATNSTLQLTRLTTADAAEYTVLVRNRFGDTKSKPATLKVLPPTSPGLVNGDFEDPRLTPGTADWTLLHQFDVPGWSTTAGDRTLKLWSDGAGVPSYSGSQHAEIHVYAAATWYQDLTGLPPGAQVGYEFAHRGRHGDESLELILTDLGADGVPGGSADTILFRKTFTTGTAAWVPYSSRGDPPILALGHTLRVGFTSLAKGSSGNYLDAVRFGPGIGGALPADSPPVILTQPADVELALGESTTLHVLAAGGTPLGYRWSRSEGPVPAANPTLRTLFLTNVLSSDAGHYSAIVTNPFGTVTSRVATVFVSSTPRPKLTGVSASEDPPYSLRVVFSTPVSPDTATQVDNYDLSPGGRVLGATFGAPDKVILDASLPAPGWYTLRVKNVRAAASDGLPVAPETQASFVLTDRHVHWSLYDRLEPGTSLDAFLGSPRYLNGWASRAGYCRSFEFPTDDQGYQLVGQLRALLYPPVSGAYRFHLGNDDVGQLFLSTTDDPRQKRMIARLDRAVPYRTYGASSGPIYLEAGRRYYLEAVYLETEDRDGIGVAWQRPGQPPPVAGDPPIPGEYLSSIHSPGIPVIQRTTTTVPGDVGQPLELELGPRDLGGSPPHAFQWLWNGTPLPGATNPTVNVPWIEPADDGAQLAVIVSNAFGTTQRTLAVLSALSNSVPPSVDWVEATLERDAIRVRFSEAVSLPSATDLANFTLSGGPTVLSATRQPDGRTVLLATTPHSAGAEYQLAVRNVVDLDGNRMPDETRIPFPAAVDRPGQLGHDVWRGPGIGRHLSTFLALPTFRNDQPQTRELHRGAEGPINLGDHYGQRLWGWIVPPATGEYRFALAADESGALYLGRDDRHADLERVAYTLERTNRREWTRHPTQLSEPRTLEAGRAYAFEAVSCEGTGPDHLALGWIPPGASVPTLIDETALLVRIDPRQLGPTIVRHPMPLVAYQHTGGEFQIAAVPGAFVPGPVRYQWQRNGLDLPEATNAFWRVRPPLDPATDSGTRYRCVVLDAAGNQVASSEATLTVLPQIQPTRIHVTAAGGLLRLTWEVTEPGVRLQQATRLRNPDWQDVPGTENVTRIDLPPAFAGRYFRLVGGR